MCEPRLDSVSPSQSLKKKLAAGMSQTAVIAGLRVMEGAKAPW